MSTIYKEKNAQNIAVSPMFFLGKISWAIIRLFFMLEMAFVILYPIMYMLSMAFRHSDDMYDISIVWIPKHFTLENFKMVWDGLDFSEAFKNTSIIAIGCTILQIIVCAITGYGFARFKFKGSTFLFLFAIFTVIIPAPMINLPNYLLFYDFDVFGILHLIFGDNFQINMIDSYLSVYLLAAFGVGLRAGLFILIFTQFFKGVPNELEEAAMIDGCGYFKTFLKIMVPNAEGPIVTTVLFSTVWYWNDYYTMTTFFIKIRSVSVKLAGIKTLMAQQMGQAAYSEYKIMTIRQAASLLVMLPIFIIFILLQKRFVRTMVNSGLVG